MSAKNIHPTCDVTKPLKTDPVPYAQYRTQFPFICCKNTTFTPKTFGQGNGYELLDHALSKIQSNPLAVRKITLPYLDPFSVKFLRGYKDKNLMSHQALIELLREKNQTILNLLHTELGITAVETRQTYVSNKQTIQTFGAIRGRDGKWFPHNFKYNKKEDNTKRFSPPHTLVFIPFKENNSIIRHSIFTRAKRMVKRLRYRRRR